MAPRLTAAICTYQRYDLLQLAIDSVLAQEIEPGALQLLVIDNSPDPDHSRAWASRYDGAAPLTWRYEATPGLSNARNVAIAAAAAPIIAFLDDDAIASQGWACAIEAAFAELGDAVHIVGGKVVPRWGGPRPEWLDDALLGYLSMVDLGPYTHVLRPNEWVVGANIAYRTDRVRDAGGFSVALGRVGGGISLMSNDEVELAERIHARGGLTGYAPAALAEHFVDPARATQDWFRRRIAWQAVSDFVRDPATMQAKGPDAWQVLKDFLASRAPAERSLRALALPRITGPDFSWQMGAIYQAVTALLAGVRDDDVG